jgi:regulation of enolase protein 1 (concanavalin A-like superfamily)
MLRTSRLQSNLATIAALGFLIVSTSFSQIGDIGSRSRPATPATQPATQPNEVGGWGTLVDPDGACTLRREGDARVTLEVPAGTFDLWPEGNKVNAPRLVQPARGDFTIQVKIAGSVMPEKGTEVPGRDITFHAASLVIWQDDGNFVRFDRAAFLKGGRPMSQTYYHINQSAKRTTHLNRPVAPDADVWLRLTRHGDEIRASWSADGKRWSDYPAQKATLAADAQAGVALLNASSAPASATFESLELQQGP